MGLAAVECRRLRPFSWDLGLWEGKALPLGLCVGQKPIFKFQMKNFARYPGQKTTGTNFAQAMFS